MKYINWVNGISTVLCILLVSMSIYLIFFMFVGFFKKKTFPKVKQKLKYGIVVAARNEEKVIADLIQSVHNCNYPQEKIDIYVIAHNCTDQTAQIARDNGAIVYEYNNPNERTKGYALKHIFECIIRDYGIESHDGYIIFDADNVLSTEYLNKMNDAFLFYDRKCVITSFRNAKNFGQNTISANYGLMYTSLCSLESKGKTVCGCTARILGSGFLLSAENLKNGWNTVILSDDTDYTIEQALEGKKVIYCDEAEYFDEQPTTFNAMYRQRLRWAKGTLIVHEKRRKSLLKSIFNINNKNGQEKPLRFSCYDLWFTTHIFPLIGFLLTLIHIFFVSLAPLFGDSAAEVWSFWAAWNITAFLIGYLLGVVHAMLVYVVERKRIKNVPLQVRINSCLTFPLYLFFIVFLQIIALFKKELVWSQIVHSSVTHSQQTNSAEKVTDNKEAKT